MRDAHNKVNTAKERRLHTVSSIKMLRVVTEIIESEIIDLQMDLMLKVTDPL